MGMIAKGIGGFIQTFAEISAGEANMRVAQQNKEIALTKAGDTRMRAGAQASSKIAEGTHRIGVITEKAAGGDVDVNSSGSVTRAIEGSRTMNARDVLAIKANAENDVFGYLMKARDEDIAIEKWKHESVLIPFKNVLGVFGAGDFNVGGGPSGGGSGGNEFLDGKSGSDFSPGGAYEGWT